MKLFRYGEVGKEKPGILLDSKHYDASAFGEDYGEHFFLNRMDFNACKHG